MSIFATIVRKVGGKAMIISGIFLLGMMLLTVASVLCRPFGTVIAGSYELIETLIIIVVAGALGYTELEKGHVTVKIVVSRFSMRLQGIFQSFIYLIGVGLWVIIAWASVGILSDRWLNEDTDILSVPILPFRFIWVFGLALFCLVLLIDFLRAINQAVRK